MEQCRTFFHFTWPHPRTLVSNSKSICFMCHLIYINTAEQTAISYIIMQRNSKKNRPRDLCRISKAVYHKSFLFASLREIVRAPKIYSYAFFCQFNSTYIFNYERITPITFVEWCDKTLKVFSVCLSSGKIHPSVCPSRHGFRCFFVI